MAYLSVIKQLEKGRELCAYCGKDITDAPDCVHLVRYVAVNRSALITMEYRHINGRAFNVTRPGGNPELLGVGGLSMRIGMEFLMDIPFLKALPLCDPDSTLVRRDLRFLRWIMSEEYKLMKSLGDNE